MLNSFDLVNESQNKRSYSAISQEENPEALTTGIEAKEEKPELEPEKISGVSNESIDNQQ